MMRLNVLRAVFAWLVVVVIAPHTVAVATGAREAGYGYGAARLRSRDQTRGVLAPALRNAVSPPPPSPPPSSSSSSSSSRRSARVRGGGVPPAPVILQRLYDLHTKGDTQAHVSQALCVCSAANKTGCKCAGSAANATAKPPPDSGGDEGFDLQIASIDRDRRTKLARVQELEASHRELGGLDEARAMSLREKVLPDEIDSLAFAARHGEGRPLAEQAKAAQAASASSPTAGLGAHALFGLLQDSNFVVSVPAVQEYYNRMKAEIVAGQSDVLAIQRGMNIVAEMKASSTQAYRASDRSRQLQVALGNRQVFAASAAQQKELDALHARLNAQSGAALAAVAARKKALEDLLRKELEAYLARLGQTNPDLENLRRQAALLMQQVLDAQTLLARAVGESMSPCMTNDDCGMEQACRHRMCHPVGENSKCTRNADCGNGQFCHIDRCTKVRPPIGSKCDTNAECGFGTRCKFFRCVMTPQGHACSTDRGCGNGQQCVAHQCRWIALPENASCALDRDCAFGQRCSAVNVGGDGQADGGGGGRCQFVADGTECGGRLSQQGNCGVQEMCANGQCVFLAAESTVKCRSTENCGVGQVCSFRDLDDTALLGDSIAARRRDNRTRQHALSQGRTGRCSFAQYGRTCEDALECVFGQRCSKHICQNVAPGSKCKEKLDCGNGQDCLAIGNGSSVCHGRRDSSVPCNTNAQCAVAHRCMGNLCVTTPPGTKCVDVNDCGNHMTCKSLRCQLDAPANVVDAAKKSDPLRTVAAKLAKASASELFPTNSRCHAAADCTDADACVFGFCTKVPVENAFCPTVSDASAISRPHPSCAVNQECKHNVCNPLYEVGAIQQGGICATTGDCANGQSCKKGRCAVVRDGTACQDSSSCGRSQHCLNHKCYSSGFPCASNFNCAEGQRCVGDRCEASVLEPSPPPCSSHSDCGNGQLCSLRQRVCVWTTSPKREGDSCSSARGQQCSSGQRCVRSRCRTVKTGARCTRQAQCGLSQTCFAGFCMWTQPADGTRCVTPFDCGAAQRCLEANALDLAPPDLPMNASVCLTIPELFACTSTDQCGNGQRCVGARCETVVLKGTSSCDSSTQVQVNASQSAEDAVAKSRAGGLVPRIRQPCGARQSCIDGKCKAQYHQGLSMPAGSVCSDAYFCGSGQRCLGGVCHNVDAYDACSSNADCGNGQQCHNGHCLNVLFGSHCLGSYDCGLRQLCQSNRCIPQYGNALTTSVPAGSPCASHIQCSFNMLCDSDGRCKFATGTKCRSNGDCGNGVRCDAATATCVASPHGSFCSPVGASGTSLRAMLPPPGANGTKSGRPDNVRCGNGQLCVKSRCVDQYGRGAPTMNIPIGTNCFGSADCGYSQRCNAKCSFVEEASPCVSTSNCGNGQQCISGACTTRSEGRPCGPGSAGLAALGTTRGGDGDCAHGQTCANGVCLRQYGRSLEIELAVRAEEDFTMEQEWKSAVTNRLSGISAMIASLAANQTRGARGAATNPAAAAAELQKLSHEQQRLREGRKVLEAEVQRRADLSFADGFGGGLLNEGCALCKAEDDISKLRDEISRLRSETRRCLQRSSQYIPSCEQDLSFQVQRLESEVTRRQALLAEEVQQLKNEAVNVRAELEQCRSARDGSCPEQREQSLSLQIMRAEDELYRRERNQLRDEQFTIINCLWQNRSVAGIDGIAKDFQVSLDTGCPRLAAKKKADASLAALHTCLCESWNKVREVRRAAAQRVDHAQSMSRAAVREQTAARTASQSKRQKEEQVAQEVSKNLAWKMLTEKSNWQDLLRAERERMRSNMTDLIRDAERKVESQAAGQQAVTFDTSVDKQKVNACTAKIEHPMVRANIQSAFSAGSGPNACSLLSLASNDILKQAYMCLCTDGAAKPTDGKH